MKVSEIIAPSFYEVHRDCQKRGHRHYWLAGGRGSTKSSFVSIEMILLLLKNSQCHAVALRKVGKTLKTSVYAQLKWAINKLGISEYFEFKLSPLEIIYKLTGQRILFLGVDDPVKIKSIKMESGYIGIVWYEELSEFEGMEEIRNVNQSLLRGGNTAWIFSSYNPPRSQNNWVNEEAMLEVPDRLWSKTNYLSVPVEWLGNIFIKEAEALRIKNEISYRHEYLGEVTGTGGAVFENVEGMDMTEEMIKNFGYIYNGLDFGFTIDPLAYVKMSYDAKHEILYIFDEVYQTGLRNKQAAEKIKPKLNGGRLACDASEPKSIADFRAYGIKAYGAKKGLDSVAFGIKWLQDRAKIYIDKRRCPNTFVEFVTYEYQRNKEGQFVSAYPDKNNHAIDACRYGLAEVMRPTNITSLNKQDFGL